MNSNKESRAIGSLSSLCTVDMLGKHDERDFDIKNVSACLALTSANYRKLFGCYFSILECSIAQTALACIERRISEHGFF